MIGISLSMFLLFLAWSAIKHRGQIYGLCLGLAIGVIGANSWVGALVHSLLEALLRFAEGFGRTNPFT